MKLMELGHWFDGPAAEIIEAYSSMPDPDSAYGTALSRLNNLFGQNSDAAMPLLKQVSTGKLIDKNEHLQLYVDIEKVRATAAKLGRSSELDKRDVISDILKHRLPHRILEKGR